jgi:hypothetical protein
VVSAADLLRSLISVYYTGAATFLSRSSSFIFTRAEWTPFQTHSYSENLVGSGIESGISGLQPRTLTTRPQRRSSCEYKKSILKFIIVKCMMMIMMIMINGMNCLMNLGMEDFCQ